MSTMTRPFWRFVDRARDRAAWVLDRTSDALYRLEERIREERTIREHREGA